MDKLHRLKGWVQQTMPLCYDDSLSYYELLAKIMYSLNITIDGLNTLLDLEKTDVDNLTNLINTDYNILNDKKENKADITYQRLLDENGNFTGTWNGLKMVNSDVGLATIVDDNTKSINKYVLSHKLDYKTVSVTTGFGTDGTSKPSISSWQHLEKQGCHATLVVMINILNVNDVNPQILSDDIFNATLADARNNNVPIDMVKLHIGLNHSDGFDRGSYTPSNTSTFFMNWQNVCLHYAQLCNNNNIPILCIGCEQPNQTLNSNIMYWQGIVIAIKNLYPNLKLTYAAKTWEFLDSNHQAINGVLDILGANVYLTYTQLPLSKETPTLEKICQTFDYNFDGKRVIQGINIMSEKYNKPVFITEIGCMPIDKGLISVAPYDYGDELQNPNYDAVNWLMQGAFTNLFRNINVVGFAWWHVDTPFCYFSDTFTTSAEQTMIDYVKGGQI